MSRKQNLDQRKKILYTAYRMFVEQGYENVTTRQIADACGMGRALLHHYYNRKDELSLAIINDIQNRLHEFLEPRLELHYLDTGWGAYFFSILFESFQYRNLFALYLEVQSNADMVWRMLMDTFFGIDKKQDPVWFKRHMTGACLIMSTVSQLVQCRMHDLLDQDNREILHTGMRVYYFYMGLPEDRVRRILQDADEFVTQDLVREFVDYYETMLDWNGDATQ